MAFKLAPYWKGVVAAVGAAAVTATTVFSDVVNYIPADAVGPISTALAVLTAIGVVLKRNEPLVEQIDTAVDEGQRDIYDALEGK